MALKTGTNSKPVRWIMIAAIAGVAFFGSYAFAQAKGAGALGSGDAVSGPVAATTRGASGSACACCGGGAAAPAEAQAPKAAEIAGDVQKISVDVSKGYYDPSTVELKAGVPAEITFSQASGCTAQVQSRDLGFSEDLSSGPKTVRLPALQAGTYSFECGMSMVFGSIVVK
jgi:plastocyanin